MRCHMQSVDRRVQVTTCLSLILLAVVALILESGYVKNYSLTFENVSIILQNLNNTYCFGSVSKEFCKLMIKNIIKYAEKDRA